MKKTINVFVIIGAMSVCKAFADDPKATVWGVTNCDVQITLTLENLGQEVKTNEPIHLLICITNASVAMVNMIETSPLNDFSFVVTSPLGKDISPKAPLESGEYFRRVLQTIAPHESICYPFNLSSVCKLNETGTYKVIAKRKTIGNCEMVSNPLFISVVPGVWKSETTNAPRSGF